VLLSCFALLASIVDPTALAGLPVAAIPIWDQYVDLIEWALRGLADYFGSGGLSIIVFTIFVKTLLLPLTVQSLRSSKAMQELQPKIKELQKKYGKDRQRLTQETMRLYSEHHVNPMSGCLPLLLQIPIFLGLYNAINHLSRSDEGPWSGTFLWLSDGLNERDPLFVLPIMAGLFQFVQTRMMRPRNQGKITDPQQAMMNTMMNFMPLTVVIFGWGFASGAVLYWATQSVYSVIQQWFITGWGSLGEWFPWLPELPEHRRLGYRAPRPPQTADPVVMSGDEKYPVRAPGALGWIQRRMEQQLEQQRARAQATGGAAPAGSAQERADAEARETAAAATARANRNGQRGGQRGGQRSRRGTAAGGARTGPRAGTARTGTTRPDAAAANGSDGATGAGGTGGGRAVVVPRKQRRAPDTDEGRG
jgi:YidC/Oxa1 family membrane protein insertase